MNLRVRIALLLLLLLSALAGGGQALALAPEEEDLAPRLRELYEARAKWLLTDSAAAPPLEPEYLPGSSRAKWALHHEQGKIRYVKQWAENRGVQFVEAKPVIRSKQLSRTEERVRFYVAQSLQLGYVYPGERTVNRFGVGSRHVLELRRAEDGRWVIASEWYSDPLGDDDEVPDVTPALLPAAAFAPLEGVPVARRGYDRQGAVAYVDQFCGMAWGCGNNHRYNPKYRDFTGVGGDCTNFVAQALNLGGKARVPMIVRVSDMAGYLQRSGKASVVARARFQDLWKRVREQQQGFATLVRPGDLVAFVERGKFEHFAMVTGFDSRGYLLVNSHTADRYHVPFDLGWDRRTVYWLFRMRD